MTSWQGEDGVPRPKALGQIDTPNPPEFRQKVIPFDNPLLPAPSQDPWVTRREETFLGLVTDGRSIFLRQHAAPQELFRQPVQRVWQAPRHGPASRHLWAPELHRFGQRWFIYYAADDGRNHNHRLFALESVRDDPAGPYRWRGEVHTGDWSIDGTILPRAASTGCDYLLWSGWGGAEKGPQHLWMASMRDPLSLAGPPVQLARPDQSWECRVGEILEGPAVWRHGGITAIVYAASASWTVHACLGMLVHRSGDYLDPAAWEKIGPVFARTPQVWGLGHCSLVPWEDGGLIFYHAKTRRTRGWRDRNIRAQFFELDAEGLPIFGKPLPLSGSQV